MEKRHIAVVPFQDGWNKAYEKEAGRLSHVLQPVIAAIHHIGSTAVPGMAAKPTIDILAEASDLEAIDQRNASMSRLGYLSYGENGIKGRRYFCMEDADGNHLIHVHIFKTGSEEVVRHLAFRDYLITHKEDADFYSNLKQELADQFPYDSESYSAGKNAAAGRIEERALQWWYGE